MIDDIIRDDMARELRTQLINVGVDPTKPPTTKPPSRNMFAEYQRRGGKQYNDPDLLAADLIKKTGEIS